MPTRKPPRKKPRAAHTELRPQNRDTGPDPDHEPLGGTVTPIQPRAPRANLPPEDDDDLDDLFNDLPV